jgi:phage recombination protein Bet
MSQALAVYTEPQKQLIKDVLAKGCSDQEIALFIEVARHLDLDPFKRQIYAIKRGDKVTFQTGIDGYRLLAERSGKYGGQLGPQWCGPDGEWKDVWLTREAPAAARVGIIRTDFREPIWGVARTDAYRQESNSLWRTMPDVMIAKCAEANAIRRAFPDQVSGIYTDTEMEQADNYVDATVEAPRATKTTKTTQSQPVNVLNPGADDVKRALTEVAERLKVSSAAIKILREYLGYGTDLDSLRKFNTALDDPETIAQLKIFHWILQHGISPAKVTTVMQGSFDQEEFANYRLMFQALEANPDDMLIAFQQHAA